MLASHTNKQTKSNPSKTHTTQNHAPVQHYTKQHTNNLSICLPPFVSKQQINITQESIRYLIFTKTIPPPPSTPSLGNHHRIRHKNGKKKKKK